MGISFLKITISCDTKKITFLKTIKHTESFLKIKYNCITGKIKKYICACVIIFKHVDFLATITRTQKNMIFKNKTANQKNMIFKNDRFLTGCQSIQTYRFASTKKRGEAFQPPL
jgi:hypothetical protein